MKRFRYETLVKIVVLITGIAFLLLHCEKSTDPEEEAPVIPPISTFVMDFESFPSDTTIAMLKNIQAEQLLLSHNNWLWAFGNVAYWTGGLVLGLVIPVAAFSATIGQVPVPQPDGSWIWTFSFTSGLITYTAKLQARIVTEGTQWDMYISKQGFYTDFLWYTGTANFLLTEGTWTVYKSPTNQVEFVGIQWHRNLQDSTADIKYTNIEVGNPGYGGYIFYGTTTDTLFNAFYNILNNVNDNITEIQWHRTNINGRIADSLHFGDTDWHCWDDMLNDVDCDSIY
jgi:hypothetical protein